MLQVIRMIDVETKLIIQRGCGNPVEKKKKYKRKEKIYPNA